jgi:hypothetical protein
LVTRVVCNANLIRPAAGQAGTKSKSRQAVVEEDVIPFSDGGQPCAAGLSNDAYAPIPDLPALAPERGGSILSGHSAPRYEIEMSVTPRPSRECRF